MESIKMKMAESSKTKMADSSKTKMSESTKTKMMEKSKTECWCDHSQVKFSFLKNYRQIQLIHHFLYTTKSKSIIKYKLMSSIFFHLSPMKTFLFWQMRLKEKEMLKDLNKQHIELIMDKNSQIKKLVDQLNQRLKGLYLYKPEVK